MSKIFQALHGGRSEISDLFPELTGGEVTGPEAMEPEPLSCEPPIAPIPAPQKVPVVSRTGEHTPTPTEIPIRGALDRENGNAPKALPVATKAFEGLQRLEHEPGPPPPGRSVEEQRGLRGLQDGAVDGDMVLKIQISRASPEESQTPPAYPLRGSSFVASLGVHSIWIALLVAVSSNHGAVPQRPVYDEFVRPYEHKIIFYNLPKKPPEVTPLQKVGVTPQPRGIEQSRRTVVATSPHPASKQQTIWLPAPKIEIHEDVPAPDLVAQLNVPGPPPPPEKPKPRAFIPPPPADRPPRLPVPAPVPLTAAPSISSTAGNANADLAIANLVPSEIAKSAIPEATRPGQFSQAPEKGAAATGDLRTASAIVPDLTIRKEAPNVVGPKAGSPGEPRPTKAILYAERLRNVPLTSVSVPLRPASRAIPKAIDARFQGRNVYTMVIPIENFPAYGGDWIIWFAERSPSVGETLLMRAPVPLRKLEPVEPPPSSSTVARVQIAAVLGTDGKLAEISVLGTVSQAVKQTAIRDAMAWEFKPATREGTPVAVELVLEIPFSLPALVTSSTP